MFKIIGNIKYVDLKEEIEKIIKVAPQISQVYIFGSRAFKTDSRSSDIDLLVISQTSTSLAAQRDYVEDIYNPLDIFETTSIKNYAKSIKTGGYIHIRPIGFFKQKNLVKQLQAILLWDRASRSFTKEIENFRNIDVYSDAIFLGSVMPIMSNIITHSDFVKNYCKEHNLPDTILGTTEKEILCKIAQIIKIPFESTFFSTCIPSGNAKKFNKDLIKIENEYDFQNLIYFILKPWLPSINILRNQDAVIVIDGNRKVADLIFNNFLIEAKYISSTSAKDGIVKSLLGLKTFYESNPRIKGILFPILCEDCVDIGESELRNLVNDSRTELLVIRNTLKN